MLRIRNNVKVRELGITKEKLKAVERALYVHPEKIQDSITKKRAILRYLGISPCLGCEDIPSFEIRYPIGDAVVVEYYCNLCKESVFERIKSEPEDPKELAEYYGCTFATSLPPTPSSVRYPLL